MGRKQRMRQQQREESRNAVRGVPARISRGTHWGWLLAVILGLAALGATTVVFVRANQAKFIKVTLTTNVDEARRSLERNQGKFTQADGERLRRMLDEVSRMMRALDRLDRQNGGQLLFYVQVVKEIAEGQELQPGELDKMEGLLAATLKQLQRRAASPTPRP
ncbi:MAG: hypothetical protein AB1439_12530 [candidate division FCPU426 bacterium]